MSQFCAGELEIIRHCRISKKEKEGRLSLLNKICYYASEFEWPVLLNFYAAWVKLIEKGENSWSDDTSLLEVIMLIGNKVLNKTAMSGVEFNTSELTISVTTERVEEILLLVKTWLDKQVATVKHLQSLLVWSVHFVNRKILVKYDNQSTVMVLNSGCTRDAYMQCCLREILFYAAKYNFEIKAVHFPGVENRTADILSRWHSDPRFEDLFYELPVIRICKCF
ncbi:unnamed protein product [Mytilus coruscus]|uniref:Uncharacterized protein n=1 Tax=Mytilus coruscus TaxID=42192 RepID=A0A6J8BAH7_MYTCO|nr:unnamed protein product [Mytilus coruscus]